MCSEILFVFTYFLILFFLNYFLFNLLRSYLQTILILQKFQNLINLIQGKINSFSKKNLFHLCSLYFFYMEKKKLEKSLKKLQKLEYLDFPLQDNIVLKNFYQMLEKNSLKIQSKTIYYYLLKKQTLTTSV